MDAFLKNIFEYHAQLNRELIDYLKKHEGVITPEMHRLFCHMLNAHQLWNSRILNTPSFRVFQLHDPAKYGELDEANTALSLHILNTYPLLDTISYTDTEGKYFQNTIGEILFHIGNHHTHHRGQLMKMFRDKGLTPLIIDYIYTTRRAVNKT